MSEPTNEENRLRSAALKNANSILQARQRAEEELLQAKAALETKTSELARSEERFRLLSEVVPLLLWSTDPEGAADYLNDRWYEYTGQTPEQALGNGWIDVLHPDDRTKTFRVWKRSVESGEAYDTNYRLRAANGEYRWFVARGVPFKDAEGRIVRWYGSCTDIHHQTMTAEALKEESAITEQLYAVSKALSTELDLEKVVQIITDTGTRITGAQFGAFFYNVLNEHGGSYMLYTLSGVPRENFDKFPMPRATELFGPTFRGEDAIRADDIRKDPRFGRNAPHHGMPAGHLPVVSYLAVPVISRNGEVLGGLFFGHPDAGMFNERDERIIVGVAAQAAAAMDSAKLLQTARQSRAAAEEANLAKDQFLAALSHELRTPLTPILAIVSSIREDRGLAPELADQLEIVQRNAELEARLIDDLLDLTRIATGKLELQCESMTVDAVIADAIRTCTPDIQAKGLELVNESPATVSALFADRARITQVLSNLLKNAVKFTQSGGRITLRSRVTEEKGKAQALIEVQDTGIGIPSRTLPRIFDAFEQGGRATTRRFGGLGLGLAISKAIVEAHEGTIEAASEGADRGSTFRLTLPLRRPEALGAKSSETIVSPHRIAPSSPARPLRILFVEDHPDTAATIALLLERTGYTVYLASRLDSGRLVAAKAMSEGGIDLVISDLGLPDGSGLELMRDITKKYGPVPAIALSGYGMESDLAQSREAGFSKHLIKPVPIAVLRKTIAEVTASQQLRS